MAENESLDLKSSEAQRWHVVRDAACRGKSCHDVTIEAEKKLYEAWKSVQKQFHRDGVSVANFMAARGDGQALKALVRRTQGAPYARLLVEVLNAKPTLSNVECLKDWGHQAVHILFDQIKPSLVGTDHFPSGFEAIAFFDKVHDNLRPNIERIATNLERNPDWKPSKRRAKGEPVYDATANELPRSLLGGMHT